MERVQSLHQQILSRYTYNPDIPRQRRQGYWVYDATHNDLKISVTLKVIRNPPPELQPYLKKMKEVKVENIIKIYELFDNEDGLFVTTEQVTYSNMKNALAKCKKLDDFDAVFLSKIILSTHADLLRAGLEWFGTEEDIEFTENGLKISWNNSIPFETACPFPLILSRLAGKMQIVEQKLLPFPKSKVLQDLITISGKNASEIGLSNYMKKKQKLSKKKGRNWICLKEYKNDYEYYQETIYFAVHKEIGFARVKSFTAGKIDQDIMTLNKTKTTFTRVIDYYDEGGKTYIVSQYSNDGSLFNYVNKLKANSIALKEDQIQFFFFSLFEPLKLIQDSPIQSLCMLHIKNIYIQSGIPKIGEPVPMNSDLKEQLKDKAQVPDFYHTKFKKNPAEKSNTYDTYSLGVLMYKLMFTEYPIFPQGKVHIPTTPSYNTRLKSTLQLFLNQGGLMKDLQKRIEVSQEVAKQVRLNKGKLLQQKKNIQKQRKGMKMEQFQDDVEKQKEEKKEEIDTEEEDDQENQGCCKLCCQQLQNPHKHKSIMLDSLEQSPYSRYRLCTKIICIMVLYIFLFYLSFIKNTFSILSNYSSLARMNVTISTVNYEVTVSNSFNFYTVFNVTDRSISSLVGTGCFINNYNSSPDYSSQAMKTSYQIYVVFGLIIMIILLVFKMIQIGKFDFIKTLYNMSNLRANFNMSNYLLFNFIFCSFLNDHYIFYNQVFNTITNTCLGVTESYNFGSTDTYFNDPSMFSIAFVTTLLLHFIILLLLLIMIVKTDTIRYTRIFNPILIFSPLLIIYSILVRAGVISNYFYPSLIKDISVYGHFFKNISYVNIIGILPQIMFLFEIIIEVIVDWTFWLIFDKRRRMLINDISSAGIIV